MLTVGRQRGLGFDIPGIEAVSEFCQHEIAAQVESFELLNETFEVGLALSIWGDRAYA